MSAADKGGICPTCGAPGEAGASYCVRCGSRLPAICPDCGGANPEDSRFCRDCGYELAASAPTTPAPVLHVSCPRCRTANEPGDDFCYSCGLPLDESSGRQTATVHPILIGRPAGFWIRVVAAIIDALCLTVVEFLLIAISPDVSLDFYLNPESVWGTGTWIDYATLLIGIAHYTVGVSVWATTIGKRAVGLYVLRPNGSRLGPGRAFARYWAPLLSALILFAGYLMVAFREDKRALHDLICDTVVVKR